MKYLVIFLIVMNLLTCIDVERIYIPDREDTSGVRKTIEMSRHENVSLIQDVSVLDLSGGRITLYPGNPDKDDNESSVCVLFQSQDCDILITGDRSKTGERDLLQKTTLPELELLIAGHHGSHLATSADLLIATRPQAVVISVGANNRYGHPREELLERLAQFGCEIYRTDLQGTIIFRR